jgi:hypothetical protein
MLQNWNFLIALTVLAIGIAVVGTARWVEYRRTKNPMPRLLPTTPFLAVGIMTALVGMALAAEVWRSRPVSKPGAAASSVVPLPTDETAKFQERLTHCWTTPVGMAGLPGTTLSIRISLDSSGGLKAAPEVVRAPASMSGPALIESAMRALQQCQPYDFIASKQYRQGKSLELTFSAQGLSSVMTSSQ